VLLLCRRRWQLGRERQSPLLGCFFLGVLPLRLLLRVDRCDLQNIGNRQLGRPLQRQDQRQRYLWAKRSHGRFDRGALDH
jgi:hypothetical protein